MDFQNKGIIDFNGQGITLPIKLVNGRPPLESGFELIRSSIVNILSWQYGKRFFLPEFGSKLEELLEEPNDQVLEEIIKVFVIEAINRWEHRVEMINSTIERNSDISINITLRYRIITTKAEDTFTFPFYKKIIH